MGDKLDFTKLKQALSTRDDFLEKHPELKDFQKEIDRLMDEAASPNERMKILAQLMSFKTQHLQLELSKLHRDMLKVVSLTREIFHREVKGVNKDDK